MSPRVRWWLAALGCLLTLAAVQYGWARAVAGRQSPRPLHIGPGQTWTAPTGARFRLVRLDIAASVVDADGKPVNPPEGAVEVVAQVHVEANPTDAWCELSVVGDQGRIWEGLFGSPRPAGVKDPKSSCLDMVAGDVYATVVVPADQVDHLEGVRVAEPGTDRRVVVLGR